MMNRITLVSISLSLSLCGPLWAQNGDGQKLTASYAAEATGQYSDAIEVLKPLAERDTADAFYQLRLGWLYYLSGQYNVAQVYYQKSRQLTSSQEAEEGLLNCALARTNWDAVVNFGTTILKKYPQNSGIMAKTGFAYYSKKDYASAAEMYRRILDIYPYNLEAKGYLLSCQVLGGERLKAKATYRELKRYSPKNPFVLEYAKQME